MNGQAVLKEPFSPWPDQNVLISDRAAKRLRIFLGKEIQVLGLRTGQVIDLADVRLRIGSREIVN
ncbi:MAG TPA: hypothetical protein VFI24_06025 [Pyrinomonadaceae bacterium]|nr:hypothetical protein [Pyrinomonadaceae bacterium]